jgi:hypothetical protein
LKTGATDGDRILNRNLLYAKRDVVQVALDNPDTLTESVRDANNIFKWLNKQINTETENLVLSQIKYDKQMERQRTTEYERVDRLQRRTLEKELARKLEREQAETWLDRELDMLFEAQAE